MEYNNNFDLDLDAMFLYYWIKMGCNPIVIQCDQKEENEEQN